MNSSHFDNIDAILECMLYSDQIFNVYSCVTLHGVITKITRFSQCTRCVDVHPFPLRVPSYPAQLAYCSDGRHLLERARGCTKGTHHRSNKKYCQH